MQKLLALLVIFFYATTLFGAYDVKIGVYKNAKNLRANIAKIKNTKYRKSIVVEKKNRLYYAHAILPSSKDARNALHAYKRVFDDAFISSKKVKIKKSVKNASRKMSRKIARSKKIQTINAKKLLIYKTIYVCYEKSDNVNKRVVKMHFEKDYITYTSLINKNKPLNIKYTFKKENIILPLSGLQVRHEIYKKDANTLYLTSFIEGKEISRLRYFFEKKDAMNFLSEAPSN
jgi:hypothetical protein